MQSEALVVFFKGKGWNCRFVASGAIYFLAIKRAVLSVGFQAAKLSKLLFFLCCCCVFKNTLKRTTKTGSKNLHCFHSGDQSSRLLITLVFTRSGDRTHEDTNIHWILSPTPSPLGHPGRPAESFTIWNSLEGIDMNRKLCDGPGNKILPITRICDTHWYNAAKSPEKISFDQCESWTSNPRLKTVLFHSELLADSCVLSMWLYILCFHFPVSKRKLKSDKKRKSTDPEIKKSWYLILISWSADLVSSHWLRSLSIFFFTIQQTTPHKL